MLWCIAEAQLSATTYTSPICTMMMLAMNGLADDDATSRSSRPHLFLDSSSSSSYSSDAATGSFSCSETLSHGRASTPHIFLSYAKPEHDSQPYSHNPQKIFTFASNNRNDRSVVSSSELIDLPLYTKTGGGGIQHPYRNEGTICLSGDRSQSTQAGQETCESRPSHTVDWKELSNAFQNQCSRYIIEQHRLSKSHAANVASAMSMALVEAASHDRTSSSSNTDYLTKYATMIDHSLTPPKQPAARDTFSSNKDNLSQTLHQNEEELRFLRSALKHMILQYPNVNTDTDESPNKLPKENFDKDIESPGDINDNVGIPTSIHFRIETDLHDDQHLLLEDHSELTPSEGDFFPESVPPLQPKRLLSVVHMENNDRNDKIPKAQEMTYPDLEKGEIRGQHTRSLDFFMYLNDLGTLLRGKYNGKISLDTGLPHGKGVFRFENRDVYIGDFADGMMHGEGCLYTRRNERLLKLRGTFHHNDFFGDGSLLEDSKGSLNVCI